MTGEEPSINRVRQRRSLLGLTQAALAERAGISRTAVTAIEGNQLVTSVASALAIAEALGTSVEDLFGDVASTPESDVWAWKPTAATSRFWRAEVSGKTVRYPSVMSPMLTLLPDQQNSDGNSSNFVQANETLVIACCDPAAGVLASQFAATTGMRLIVLPRSSREAIMMLRDGLVHLAGLHFSTREKPERNEELIRSELGAGFQSVRVARWQEGIVLRPTSKIRSVRAAVNAKLNWIGREPGSGARQCLDQILKHRSSPRRMARDHCGVVEAVRSGWADAGVCIQVVGAEAGLDFLPVQDEAFDVCFSSALVDDRRIKAFLSVVRSNSYRRLIGDIPGYDTSETGNVWAGY